MKYLFQNKMRIPTQAAFFFGLLIIASCNSKAMGTDCSKKILSTAQAPDLSLTAEVAQNICGGSMTTDVSNSVSILKPGQQPGKDDVVFELDVGGDIGLTPQVAWLSNKKLQISVDRSVIKTVDFVKSSYKGVEIVLVPKT